jgi:hypothetical protein
VVKARGKAKRATRTENRKLKVGIDIPAPAEIKLLVPQLQGRLRALFLTAIFTGLRWSELRGLTWDNVDWAQPSASLAHRPLRCSWPTKSEAGGTFAIAAGTDADQHAEAHKLATGGHGSVREQQGSGRTARRHHQRAAGGAGRGWHRGRRERAKYAACMRCATTPAGASTRWRRVWASTSRPCRRAWACHDRRDDGAELAAGELALVG